jgi:hypothetical protein
MLTAIKTYIFEIFMMIYSIPTLVRLIVGKKIYVFSEAPDMLVNFWADLDTKEFDDDRDLANAIRQARSERNLRIRRSNSQ